MSRKRTLKEKGQQNNYQQNILLNLKNIKPLKPGQKAAFDGWNKGLNLFQHGCPGTGKSYTSLYLALKTLQEQPDLYKRIIIVRSAVATRDQGFLPGNPKEKQAVFEEPYINIVNDLYDNERAYQTLKLNQKIIFNTTSYLRGLTFDDCILYFDEVQSNTMHEINTLISRAGNNCRVILSGDYTQSDLNKPHETTGIYELLSRMKYMQKFFALIDYQVDDIVRGELCKAWILSGILYEEQHKSNTTTLSTSTTR